MTTLDWSQCPAVVEQFDVTREQITAVLDFVAQSLKVSAPRQPPHAGRCSLSLTTERQRALPVNIVQ